MDDFDFRMEGRGNPRAPKGMFQKSQNTGPKGVKKDYEDAKEAVRIQKNFDRMRSERALERNVTGTQNFYIDDLVHEMEQLDQPITQTEEEKQRSRAKENLRARKNRAFDDSFSDEASDSDDERQFNKFREERLKFIKAQLPSYGSYMKADSLEELAELLKNNHELCFVVVHVYQNKNPCCISLHLTFEHIATQFPHVAFVRMRSDVALGASYEAAALPTLLLYKGSKLHKSVMSVGAILGVKPGDRDVVQFLANHDVLKMPTMGLENITRQDKRQWKEDYEEGNSDSDGENSYSQKNKAIRSSTLTSGFGTTGFDSNLLRTTRTAGLFGEDDDAYGNNSGVGSSSGFVPRSTAQAVEDDDDDDFFNDI